MLAAGFIYLLYVGAFDNDLREELRMNQWSADIKIQNVLMMEGSDPPRKQEKREQDSK